MIPRKPYVPLRNALSKEIRVEKSGTPWEPHAYQRKAIKFLLSHGAAGLFLDPG
jgi:hypothetical protein